ncbi:hypothetical protein HDU86_008529 [Geranomyces michiganensis]|nr:hypothetical protein HDU86_008529 [Geranomyces michiganensis]
MYLSSAAEDTVFFLVACFALVVILLGCSLYLLHTGGRGHVVKILVVQHITAVLYYTGRAVITAYGSDPLCGGCALFAGAAMWYTTIGLYYIVVTQKTKALLAAICPKIPSRWFLAGQLLVLVLFCVNVIWACVLTSIHECRIHWGGLKEDFIFTIIVQSIVLIADICVYAKLRLLQENSKWVDMQLAYLQEAILLMVYLIASNIHVYYNWIPTVNYILWYHQIVSACMTQVLFLQCAFR